MPRDRQTLDLSPPEPEIASGRPEAVRVELLGGFRVTVGVGAAFSLGRPESANALSRPACASANSLPGIDNNAQDRPGRWKEGGEPQAQPSQSAVVIHQALREGGTA